MSKSKRAQGGPRTWYDDVELTESPNLYLSYNPSPYHYYESWQGFPTTNWSFAETYLCVAVENQITLL